MNSADRLVIIKEHIAAIAENGDYGKIVGALKASADALPVARGDQGNAAIAGAESTVVAAVATYVADIAPFMGSQGA